MTEMGRRRMLTPELVEECQYDCNYEIRKYAEGKNEKEMKKSDSY